jgi:hypothetical protein
LPAQATRRGDSAPNQRTTGSLQKSSPTDSVYFIHRTPGIEYVSISNFGDGGIPTGDTSS